MAQDEQGKKLSLDEIEEHKINLTLLNPLQWGWTASGSVADVLSPHEKARARSSREEYLRGKGISTRKRRRQEAFASDHSMTVATTAVGELSPGTGNDSIANNLERTPLGTQQQQTSSQLLPTLSDTAKQSSVHTPEVNKMQAPTLDIENGQNDENDIDYDVQRRFTVLQSDRNMLDISAYHRGRSGVEMRDKETGTLLCDTDAVDSSYNRDCTIDVPVISVRFPIDRDETQFYQERLEWDLNDSTMHTPYTFALAFAQEYNLNYAQCFDLSEQIQQQLNSFIYEKNGFATVTALHDSIGTPMDNTAKKPINLYGEVTDSRGVPGFLPLPPINVDTSQRSNSVVSRLVKAQSEQFSIGSIEMNGARKSSTKITAAEAKYREEIRRRLVLDYLRECDETNNKSSNETDDGHNNKKSGVKATKDTKKLVQCHVCSKSDECTLFSCNIKTHGFCSLHISEVSIQKKDGEQQQTQSIQRDKMCCPICCLICECDACTSTLRTLANRLKKACGMQGRSTSDVVYEDLLTERRSGRRSQPKKSIQPKQSSLKEQSAVDVPQTTVQKVPQCDFPRETCNGLNIDPASSIDYRTVFSRNGSHVLPEPAAAPSQYTSPMSEVTSSSLDDSNIDYCWACKSGNSSGYSGNRVLVCCDFCPRAYHYTCIRDDISDDNTAPAKTQWNCPVCKELPTKSMIITGSRSLTKVAPVYGLSQLNQTSLDVDCLRAIAVVDEILECLMDSDFGGIFKEPVNPDYVPTYLDVITQPMDLGTVRKNIMDGKYSLAQYGSYENAILKLVDDIELIWRNCFTFNPEWSVYYRMGIDMKRRMRMMYKQNVKHRLPEIVFEKVETIMQQTDARVAPVLRCRHKIVCNPRSNKGKAIAVFNPDTGRIVKVYTTVNAAISAVEMLVNLNHEAEVKFSKVSHDLNNQAREAIKRSSSNPKTRLFGYRWVLWESLQKGQVKFADSDKVPDIPQDGQEVRNGKHEHTNTDADDSSQKSEMIKVYDCKENGVSQQIRSLTDYTSKVISEQSKNAIRALKPGEPFIDTDGRQWATVSAKRKDLVPHYYIGKSSGSESEALSSDSVVYRYNAHNGSISVSFDSLDAACADWQKYSVELEGKNVSYLGVDHFAKMVLDTGSNIQGNFWKSVEKSMADKQSVVLDAPPTGATVNNEQGNTSSQDAMDISEVQAFESAYENNTGNMDHSNNDKPKVSTPLFTGENG